MYAFCANLGTFYSKQDQWHNVFACHLLCVLVAAGLKQTGLAKHGLFAVCDTVNEENIYCQTLSGFSYS